MARYNPTKAFLPALTGKFLMSLAIALGGRFSIGIITNMFGAGSSLLSFIFSAMLGIIIAITMFKVDWTKYFKKLVIK
jgi:hypothetical protein